VRIPPILVKSLLGSIPSNNAKNPSIFFKTFFGDYILDRFCCWGGAIFFSKGMDRKKLYKSMYRNRLLYIILKFVVVGMLFFHHQNNSSSI
jgi:hypothetical protein